MNAARSFRPAPLQESILLHALSGAAAARGMSQAVVRWSRPVPGDALRASWRKAVARHPALRAGFRWDGDAAVGTIAEALEAPVEERLVDASAVSGLCAAERARPIDPARPPLFRLLLLRSADGSTRLVWTLHPILLDPASQALVLRDVLEDREPHPAAPANASVEPLLVGFGDGGAAEAFWREHLRGLAAATRLPRLAPSPSEREDAAGRTVARLDATRFARLREAIGGEGVGLDTALEAAWALLLHRYTGEGDVLFGVGRDLRPPGADGVAGVFLNVVPRRVVVQPARRADEWLREMQAAGESIRAAAHCPLGRLRACLPPSRGGDPLFDSAVHLDARPAAPGSDASGGLAAGCAVEYFDPPDIPLFATACRTGDLDLAVSFARRDFDEAAAGRIAAHWRALLASLPDALERPVADWPWLDDEERRLVVRGWNETARAGAPPPLAHELVEAAAARAPAAAAVEMGGRVLGYGELLEQSAALAGRLKAMGVGRDVRVPLCMERSPDLMVAVLAVLRAGGAYVPLDPHYPPERLRFMLSDAGAPLCLTEAALLPRLSDAGRGAVDLAGRIVALPLGTLPAAAPAETADPESLAYVIYTSGSTGRPKGVAMVHRALANLLAWHRRALPAGENLRTLQYTSLSFDVSFQEIFSTWAAGGTLVLVDERMRRDPIGLWRHICRERVSRLFLPFVALQQLAEAAGGAEDGPCELSDVITAGEQLIATPQIRALFSRRTSARLHNHYGPTETHVVTAHTLGPDPRRWPSLPPIGRPIDNVRAFVLDARLSPLPAGVPGELCLAGDGLARGYLGRPDLERERFVEAPGLGRVYRTGDMAAHLSDGVLQFLGRNDDQVKIRGFRVELGEVESALREHADVLDGAVRVSERSGEKVLDAFVVPQPGTAFDAGRLRDFLKGRLADYLMPSRFVALDRLPLTPSGKVDRRALPDAGAVDAGAGRGRVALLQGLEEAIAGVWCEVLGVSEVGATDNFFDVGGTSLLMLRLHRGLRDALARDVEVTTLFQYPTIRALAGHLAPGRDAAPAGMRAQDRAARQREAFARARAAASRSVPRAP